MARSTQEIYDLIITELSNYSVLNGIVPVPDDFEQFSEDVTSNSRVEPARHLIYGVSYIIHTLEVIFDAFKTDVTNIANTAIPQTERWMRNQTLKFQNGDELVWDGDKYAYPTINTANQIIGQAAVVTSNGTVYVKAVKDNGGVYEPLTTAEQTSLQTYWKLLIAPGTNFSIISQDADALKIELDIIYDPLVLESSGMLINVVGDPYPVDAAIETYNKSLDFNGRFWVDKFVDAIQAAEGVISVDLNGIQATYGGLSYEDVDKYYDSFAGWMALDTANSTINYITA